MRARLGVSIPGDLTRNPSLSVAQEFLGHPRNLVRMRPDERVVSRVDQDEARSGNSVVEHIRVLDRYRLIVRSGDDERRTGDLGQRPLLSNAIAPRQADAITLASWPAMSPVSQSVRSLPSCGADGATTSFDSRRIPRTRSAGGRAWPSTHSRHVAMLKA